MADTDHGTARARPAPRLRARTGVRWKTGILALVIALQLISALFFVGDVFADMMAIGLLDMHTSYEALATVALILGVVLGGIEMQRIIAQGRRSDDALKMASGAFSELITERFNAWSLTEAETQVALLTLKGFEGREIADLRGTAPGTIRAQLTSIYAKSGTASRGQFVSVFIDTLIDTPVAG